MRASDIFADILEKYIDRVIMESQCRKRNIVNTKQNGPIVNTAEMESIKREI